jgi:hypothetical protein
VFATAHSRAKNCLNEPLDLFVFDNFATLAQKTVITVFGRSDTVPMLTKVSLAGLVKSNRGFRFLGVSAGKLMLRKSGEIDGRLKSLRLDPAVTRCRESSQLEN